MTRRFTVIFDPNSDFPFRVLDTQDATVIDGADNLGSAQRYADELEAAPDPDDL